MTMEEAAKLLEEISKAGEDARWISRDAMAIEGAHAFGASTAAWKLLVVSFSIEDQGFPEGSVGYDGTAVNEKGIIVRLTRELAEKFFKQAEGQKGIPR